MTLTEKLSTDCKTDPFIPLSKVPGSRHTVIRSGYNTVCVDAYSSVSQSRAAYHAGAVIIDPSSADLFSRSGRCRHTNTRVSTYLLIIYILQKPWYSDKLLH